jgi:hypothetical protein
MPVTPNIIQTAKQTVKAQVLTNRTDVLPDLAIRTSKPSMPAVGADRHYAKHSGCDSSTKVVRRYDRNIVSVVPK